METENWGQLGNTINATGEGSGTGFNLSLNHDGTILAAYHKEYINDLLYQSVKVLKYDGSSWNQLGQTLLSPSRVGAFGQAISLNSDGTILAVGARAADIDLGERDVFSFRIKDDNGNDQYLEYDDETHELFYHEDYTNNSSRAEFFTQFKNDGTKYFEMVAAKTSKKVVRFFSKMYIDELNNITENIQLNLGYNEIIPYDSENMQFAITRKNNDGTKTVSSFQYIYKSFVEKKDVTNPYDNVGSVYVYKWDGSSWVQRGSTLSGENLGDQFGSDVKLDDSGTSLLVGAYNYSIPGSLYNGALYYYTWDGSTWTQKGQTLFGDRLDYIGRNQALGMSPDGKIISVNSMQISNSSSGGYVKFYIYNKNTSLWEQNQSSNIIPNNLKATGTDDRFGREVKIKYWNEWDNLLPSADLMQVYIAAISSYNFDGKGKVEFYVLGYNEEDFTLGIFPFNLFLPDNDLNLYGQENNGWFGRKISLSTQGTILTVSESRADKDHEADPNSDEGKVYIYEYNLKSGLFEQKGRTLEEDETVNYGFDSEVSGNGKIVAAANHFGENSFIKVFEYTSTWDICFKAGSSIETDQGIFNIEDLNPSKHTIDNQEIIAITTTHPSELEYLVCIEKDAFGLNVPNKDTYLTHTHKVQYKGQLVEAMTFLLGDFNNKIYKVEYKNERLYNVLLKDYTTMNVNNLVAETLDPKNLVAQKYLNKNNKESNLLH